MKINEFCRKKSLSVLMICLGFLLFGFLSMSVMELEELPDIESSRISIICEYSGLPPEEMERIITAPLEEGLSGTEGLSSCDSEIASGYSRTDLSFLWGTDMGSAAVSVREAVDLFYPYMPTGMEKPRVETFIYSDASAITLAAVPAAGLSSLMALSPVRELKNRILDLDETALVRTTGLREREVHI
ncbi:MAG: efflux RND transporter permease subunit, partial [Spirochaetales bacterium]|nr:efflux RND transporter permease subunit [Spirochaetales bacterium]